MKETGWKVGDVVWGYTCNDKDEKQVLEKSEICEREQK